MNKYNQLREEIILAVPDIMKRQFGCKVIVESIREDNYGCEYDIIVDERIENGEITLGYFGKVPLEKFKIIGRPISLEDCLIAIEKKEDEINKEGKSFKHFKIWANGLMQTNHGTGSGYFWKRGKPLQDQSDECKELLWDLICKK